ncbi:MAG TPA: PspC domain-containing protein [Gaiellaceae bacterium]|nr:PspC domain-containing protein [Gaiellaceae bacterium]
METTETLRRDRRLVRPHDGRWLGGVSAGLGHYFDLNPTIYRVAFVALALAGGTGLLLYAAAWVVIPDEGADDSAAVTMLRRQGAHPARAIGLALIAFVAILVLGEAHLWPDPGNVWLAAAIAGAGLVWWHASGRATALPGGDPAAARRDSLFPLAAGGVLCAVGVIALLDLAGAWHADWRYVLGGMVAALGGVVALGAFTDRAVGGVLGIGLLMIAALAVTLAVRVPLFAGFGDRTSHPTTIASLDTSYELGMGNLTLNLADLPLPTGETHVKATLGIGDLTVRVPADAAVDVDARASGGQVVLFGRIDDGTSVHEHAREGAGTPARTLVLDARVGFGRVTVTRG